MTFQNLHFVAVSISWRRRERYVPTRLVRMSVAAMYTHLLLNILARHASNPSFRLYAQCHDTVDNIVVVLLERLDSLLPANAGLGHDELNVLSLKPSVVNLLTIVLLLLTRLARAFLDGLALVGALSRVVVRSLVGGLRGELLGSGSLSLNVQVLDLGLTENAATELAIMRFQSQFQSFLHPGVAVRRLVHIRVADDEENVLWSPQSNASDAVDVLQAELCNGLARLLLVSAVHSDLRTSGNVGITTLLVRV